jgi:hypothetical protein
MHDGDGLQMGLNRRGSTADPNILRENSNTSSIMVHNASSIMQGEAGEATSD